jgi:hypothetical protein
VLDADLLVAQASCLFLRLHDHPTARVGEPFEHHSTMPQSERTADLVAA